MSLRLYYFPTPNGRKVAIALEEMGLAYEVRVVHILKNEQIDPDYLRINPNGRIPALTDDTGEGEPVAVFESGAMLQYLGRKTGMFYPAAEAQRCVVDSWLHWQMAGLGPMTGQVTFFKRAAQKPERDPESCAFAIRRFEKEMRRLYEVLESQLDGRDFICGDYSIADMACWPWVKQHGDYLGDLSEFPNIRAWRDRIGARPAVERALKVGTDQIPEFAKRG